MKRFIKPTGIKILYNKQHMLTGANIIINIAGVEMESPLVLENFEEWIRDLPDSYFKINGTKRGSDFQKLERAYGYVSISDPRTLNEKSPILTKIQSTITNRINEVASETALNSNKEEKE